MENITKEINRFNRNLEHDTSKWNVKWVFFLVGEGGWRHQYLYCFLEYLQNEVEAKENKTFVSSD